MIQESQEFQSAEADDDLSRLAGKYLTFTLGGECYGLDILKVQEIISLGKNTRVPKCPPYMKGIINLRGKIIPVIDLRVKFSMPEVEYSSKSSIVVVHITVKDQRIPVGVIVDLVREVLPFDASAIEPAPKYGLSVNTEYVRALGKSEKDVVILLDIDKVLSAAESAALVSAVGEQAQKAE